MGAVLPFYRCIMCLCAWMVSKMVCLGLWWVILQINVWALRLKCANYAAHLLFWCLKITNKSVRFVVLSLRNYGWYEANFEFHVIWCVVCSYDMIFYLQSEICMIWLFYLLKLIIGWVLILGVKIWGSNGVWSEDDDEMGEVHFIPLFSFFICGVLFFSKFCGFALCARDDAVRRRRL